MQRFLKISLLLLVFIPLSTPAHSQIQQIREELQRLGAAPDSMSRVNSLNRLGRLYRTRNADSGFHYGMEAKRLALHIGYEKGQAEADQIIAYSLFKRGLYAESLELFGQLLARHQRIGDTLNIVRTYVDIASVRNQGIGEREEQLSLMQKAVQMGRQLENDSIMGSVYLTYIIRNTTLSDDSIRYYLDRSREIANRHHDESTLILNQLQHARLLMSDNQREKALPLVGKALSDARRIGNANLEINALFLMVGFCEGNLHTSLDYLYQAYEVARQSGDRSLEIYILNNALDVARQLGDKDEIIKAYAGLESSMSAEWENSKKFINDYIHYQTIQDDNRLLSRANTQRTIWLIVISFSAVLLILLTYLLMLHRNRKAKAKIESLNEMVNIQVIAMEEIKHLAVREEQKRLGQDLHDGLSSTIASIGHQLELLWLDTDDPDLKTRLGILRSQTAEAYATTRDKSHEWFATADRQHEQSFEKQIISLTKSALPDSRYNKNIHIDDHALTRIPTDVRIALLRIIQEALVNIIKHARAKNIEILLYKEQDKLILSIKDDGKGFLDLNMAKSAMSGKTTALGLRSIQRRAQYLRGELQLNSDSGGTIITLSIPL